MATIDKVLKSEEKAVFSLRALYEKYGYSQYRMSKFEEYDLYVKNKDFLVSENVITFTDTDGKLLALKPDVTLSIIKNDKDSLTGVKKVYYNEHVYRVSKGSHSFKEIMQVGLECLGEVDDYVVCEVLYLASKSLKYISDESVLDISHLGIVKSIIDYAKISNAGEKKILSYLGDKNVEGVKSVCIEEGVDEERQEILAKLVTVYGNPKKVLGELNCFNVSPDAEKAINEFTSLINNLIALGVGENINVDFSVVNNMGYYNGVVFNGFVNGIPTGILSGGQYDKLMEKMGKKSSAIGFAVYLDELEKLEENNNEYDVDILLLYDQKCSLSNILLKVKELTDNGETVLVQKSIPERIRFKRLIDCRGE